MSLLEGVGPQHSLRSTVLLRRSSKKLSSRGLMNCAMKLETCLLTSSEVLWAPLCPPEGAVVRRCELPCAYCPEQATASSDGRCRKGEQGLSVT